MLLLKKKKYEESQHLQLYQQHNKLLSVASDRILLPEEAVLQEILNRRGWQHFGNRPLLGQLQGSSRDCPGKGSHLLEGDDPLAGNTTKLICKYLAKIPITPAPSLVTAFQWKAYSSCQKQKLWVFHDIVQSLWDGLGKAQPPDTSCKKENTYKSKREVHLEKHSTWEWSKQELERNPFPKKTPEINSIYGKKKFAQRTEEFSLQELNLCTRSTYNLKWSSPGTHLKTIQSPHKAANRNPTN